jgi:hypothetical protein
MLRHIKPFFMKNPRLQLSFTTYSDTNFLNKGKLIVTSMTNNPAFTNPIPTLAEVQAALDTYSNNLTLAAQLGRLNVAEKNQSRATLEQLLSQLGLYVMFIANGDEAILVSSGFTLAKNPQPRKLESPGNVILAYGITAGTLVSSVSKGNATSFIHEIADVLPAEETNWTSYPGSTSIFTFTNLTPGKQYWVRVAAIGNRKQIAYSNTATQFASL